MHVAKKSTSIFAISVSEYRRAISAGWCQALPMQDFTYPIMLLERIEGEGACVDLYWPQPWRESPGCGRCRGHGNRWQRDHHLQL